MATDHTPNYQLSQWRASDVFVRTDFNEDHLKIDAALHALASQKADQTAVEALTTQKAEQSAVTGLQQQIQGLSSSKADQTTVTALQGTVSSLSTAVEQRCKVKAGIYQGDGNSSQFIDVGFSVAAVLVENQQGSRNESSSMGSRGGLAVVGGNLVHGISLIKVSGTGFYVYNGGEYQGAFNRSGSSYLYVAWGK